MQMFIFDSIFHVCICLNRLFRLCSILILSFLDLWESNVELLSVTLFNPLSNVSLFCIFKNILAVPFSPHGKRVSVPISPVVGLKGTGPSFKKNGYNQREKNSALVALRPLTKDYQIGTIVGRFL